MPRSSRVVIAGCAHHVTQRGNNRQDVFFVDDDRRVFLTLLADAAERFDLTVEGYCLMTNHVHLVATPRSEGALAKAIGRTHWLYARWLNRLHGRSGHLWQNRFYSCALDRRHFIAAVAYVERNPVRAKMHRKAWLYRWSSAAAHCGEPDKTRLLDLRSWRRHRTEDEWREELSGSEDPELLRHIRTQTHRGRPLAGDSFMSKVEKLLGRRVRPMPVGRPKIPRHKKR